MFRTCLKIFWILLSGLSLFLVFFFCRASEEEKKRYAAIMEQSKPKESKEEGITYCEQRREGISKHVWLQKNERLEGMIESEKSTLFLFPAKNKIDVVEGLENVRCLFQEKLFFDKGVPMQELRYLVAEKATHNYNSNLFIAEKVKIWKYCIPGHVIPDSTPRAKPIMEGVAEEVTVSLQNGEIKMKANHLKASFDPKKEGGA